MISIFTIGYEGTDIDRFSRTLRIVGVELLIDVRAVALSRKRGFSKNALRSRLSEEGIAYQHMIELGDPKPGREAARAGRYDEFRRIYITHLASAPRIDALNELARLAAEKVTCIMCFERDPLTCHRSIVGDGLRTHYLAMFHLFGDDPSKYDRNASKLPSRHFGESATAAQQNLW